jgi:hypothetical protein
MGHRACAAYCQASSTENSIFTMAVQMRLCLPIQEICQRMAEGMLQIACRASSARQHLRDTKKFLTKECITDHSAAIL